MKGATAEWVRAYVEAGRAAWPELALEGDVFERHALARAGDEPLPIEHAADLFLACACANRVAGAAEAFERRFSRALEAASARAAHTSAARDEAVQAIRAKLLVAERDEVPKIAGYAGRAPLERWLAAVAARTAIAMRRNMADRPHDTLTSAVREAADDRGPEVAYVRARYKADFEAAVRAALGALSARDATLLRLSIEEGLGVDALARMYGVGRSTAGRWLQSARGELEKRVKKELRARLRMTPAELESIAAVLLSQLEVSVVGALRAGAARR